MNSQNFNPYKILDLPIDATDIQIKKAYRKLVLKYHPDKSNDPESIEKFKEIQTAYEILISKTHRNEFDNINNDINRYEYYQTFKVIIENKYPKMFEYFKFITNLFYKDENELKLDIDNLKFDSLYEKIINRLPSAFNKLISDLSFNFINSKNNLEKETSDLLVNQQSLSFAKKNITNDINQESNIIHTIKCTISDVIYNRYRKIKVDRVTRDPIILYIPLRKTKKIFKNEGELFISQSNINYGDIIIIIKIQPTDEENKYLEIIDGNYIYNLELNLFEYLYGTTKNIYDSEIAFEPLCLSKIVTINKCEIEFRIKIKDYDKKDFMDKIKLLV